MEFQFMMGLLNHHKHRKTQFLYLLLGKLFLVKLLLLGLLLRKR
jgi:uncharacterized membrane protein YsdA (DUF1294 family)